MFERRAHCFRPAVLCARICAIPRRQGPCLVEIVVVAVRVHGDRAVARAAAETRGSARRGIGAPAGESLDGGLRQWLLKRMTL